MEYINEIIDGCHVEATLIGPNKRVTLTINVAERPKQASWIGKKAGDILTPSAALSYRVEKIYIGEPEKPVEPPKPPVPGTKPKKTLDEMFAPDYHAEKLARSSILTYQQVESKFGIRIAGFGRGINPTPSTVVLISSIRKTSDKFVYHDKWTADGDYLYSGEGKTGDQTMTKGNLAIKTAARDGKEIHLFVKFSPEEYYYQGVFALVSHTYENEEDEDGNIRKEYKFRLGKVKP